jgi:hypothetical protein
MVGAPYTNVGVVDHKVWGQNPKPESVGWVKQSHTPLEPA